jgi:integrase
MRKLEEDILRRIRIVCQRNGPETSSPGQATFEQIHQDIREFVRPLKAGTLRSIIHQMIEEGILARFRSKKHTYRPVALDRVSLADLLTEARTQIDPTHRRAAGRRATVGGSREVQTISQRQWERMRSALRKLARSRHPQLSLEEAMAQPASDLCHWAPDAGPGGEGDWQRLVAAMERASKPSTRSDDVSAIRTLADLSATHGWIARSERHDPDYTPVPAAWAEVQDSWRIVMREAGYSRAASISLLLLTAVAELLGDHVIPRELTPDDWDRVRCWVEDEMLDRGWPTSGRSQLRMGFQALRAAGLVNAHEWKAYYHREQRARNLIARQDRIRISKAYGREHRGEVPPRARLTAIAGLPNSLSGLKGAESPYGLHQLLEHFTRRGTHLGEDIPARAAYPNEEHRSIRPSTRTAWAEATVFGNLEMIGYVVGWLNKERDVDWTTSDLRQLVTPETLNWIFSQASGGKISEDRARRILVLLARIASPYLETIATNQGDEEMAREFAHASQLANSPSGAQNGDGSRLVSLASRLREEAYGDDPQIRKRRRKAQAVERAYQFATGESSAYEGMWKIFRFARREFLDRVGVAESSELGSLPTRSIWQEAGKLLRDLVYVQDQLMVPLRARSSTLITMRMRNPDMSAHYPAQIFKVAGNGEMDVRYSTPDGAGPYDVHLWHAYSRTGGVRAMELARREEDTDAVYVAFGRETLQVSRGANGEQMLAGRRDHFVGAVRRVLEAARLGGLDLDPQFLIDEGVATTHQFRHAAATWLCGEGRVEEAALLLHHSNLDMVQRIYSGRTAAAGSEVIMRSLGTDE